LTTQHLRACYDYCKQHADELNDAYRKKVFVEFVKAMKERRDGVEDDGDDDQAALLQDKEGATNDNNGDDSDDEEAMLEAMLENSDQFDDDFDDDDYYDSDDCGKHKSNKRARIG
jgi:hypothetical protein